MGISAEREDFDEISNLANSHGASVFEVDDSTAQGSQFCNSFNMGGCLRWPVDPDLLDSEEKNDTQQCDDEDGAPVDSHGASVCEEIREISYSPTWGEEVQSCPPGSTLWSVPKENWVTADGIVDLVGDELRAVFPVKVHIVKETVDFVTLAESATLEAVGVLEAEPSDIASKHRHGLLDWLKDSLTTVLEDLSSVDALVACADVVLGDEFPIQEEALSDTIAMLVGEGVPQHVVEELERRAM